jgi:hypothetical protein
MKLQSSSFQPDGPIPSEFAFGKQHPTQHMELSQNRSPHLRWSEAPQGTRSFAVICHDPDVPSDFSDGNQEGKTIQEGLPRIDFFHWLLVDIPADVTELPAGADSDRVTLKGKPIGKTRWGRRGVNDYTAFMAGNPDMAGIYGGYDGPCPPWNDERKHRYVFTVYALSVPALNLPDRFTGADALKAMQGRILAQASLTGTYTLNPKVKA